MSRIFNTVLAATGAFALGYVIYFDYQRRNSAEFRKSLFKNKKRAEQNSKASEAASKQVKVQLVKQILVKSLAEDPIPTDAHKKEEFFMTSVTMGEQLASMPGAELEAALQFYRALSIYPNPTDILNIYQKSIPSAVYEYVIMMIAINPPSSVASFLNEGAASAPTPAAEILEEVEQD
ncbi:hypothetical protein WICPIJ_000316 [Wickerhamomyces pijperi]|uniref:Mitochondrial import receptor subunit TOM20 n=1 Tax=Wickerhamomyces pijperi TaxID=599730 RepID=A0A9P8TSU6_WICPI|nr:hypothetical protein WICPIJ_000316 [Wickerhamomyces pijperi]